MPTLEDARAWYPAGDPVHGFDHVLRVYRMAERLAATEEADMEIVRAAALLHDAQDPHRDAGREQHHYASAAFAEKVLRAEGWSGERIEAVVHCIRAHRFRDPTEESQSTEARVLFDADKLDAIGAIGVARAIAYAALHGQPAYVRPSESFLEANQKEPGEGHSAYHEYLYKLSNLKDMLFTETGRLIAEQRHITLKNYFTELQAEIESRR